MCQKRGPLNTYSIQQKYIKDTKKMLKATRKTQYEMININHLIVHQSSQMMQYIDEKPRNKARKIDEQEYCSLHD